MGKPTPPLPFWKFTTTAGEHVAPGVTGEIVYRPRLANIMLKEYYRDPDATLANMRGLWWHTGDVGYVDADGFFYFVGRKKDSMRRCGENVSSHELESVAAQFAGLGEVAAVATSSDVGQITTHACARKVGTPAKVS